MTSGTPFPSNFDSEDDYNNTLEYWKSRNGGVLLTNDGPVNNDPAVIEVERFGDSSGQSWIEVEYTYSSMLYSFCVNERSNLKLKFLLKSATVNSHIRLMFSDDSQRIDFEEGYKVYKYENSDEAKLSVFCELGS